MTIDRSQLVPRWLEIKAELRQLRGKPDEADRGAAEERLQAEKEAIEVLLELAFLKERRE